MLVQFGDAPLSLGVGPSFKMESGGADKKDLISVDRGLFKGTQKIHGLNPALLVEKIVRERIQDSHYWISKASTINFYSLLDECIDSVHVVGVYINKGKTVVSRFMCLLFRLIHIQPPIDVVLWLVDFRNHKFKYICVLFSLYYRIICENPVEIYNVLEPLLEDYRKIRVFDLDGTVKIAHVDEIIDGLLETSKFYGITLPLLTKRWVLEEKGELEERESKLMEEFEQELERQQEDVED